MKRLFWVLTILFVIPIVYADISLNEIGKQSYNLGDTIDVSGYVLENSNVEGILRMDLICEKSIPVYFSMINLRADDRYSFSQTIPVRENMVGECYLDVKLVDSNNNVISEKESGKLSISNKLNVAVKLNKADFLPGEELVIDGAVDASSGKVINNAKAAFDFNGKVYNADVDGNGKFNYVLELPANIKSGEYIINIYVEDPYGNKGNSDNRISVESVVTSIEIDSNKITFNPGEELVIIANVYDQAGELISQNFTLELVGPNEEIINKSVSGEFKLSFDQFALPGMWIIRASNEGIVSEEKITVNEVRDIDTELNGSTLFITNIGNVDYNDVINFELSGEKNYQINKEVGIKPGQTITMDLEEEEIPGGQYQVMSPGNMITGNVVLTSKTGQRITETAGYIVLSVIVLFIAFTFAKKKKINDGLRKVQRLEGKRVADKIRKTKYPQVKTRFGTELKVNESDVKHWINKATSDTPKKEERDGFGIFD